MAGVVRRERQAPPRHSRHHGGRTGTNRARGHPGSPRDGRAARSPAEHRPSCPAPGETAQRRNIEMIVVGMGNDDDIDRRQIRDARPRRHESLDANRLEADVVGQDGVGQRPLIAQTDQRRGVADPGDSQFGIFPLGDTCSCRLGRQDVAPGADCRHRRRGREAACGYAAASLRASPWARRSCRHCETGRPHNDRSANHRCRS